MQNNDRYEIDVLINNQWKLLRYCSSIGEVCSSLKAYNEKRNDKMRVLDNNILLQFIDGSKYGVEAFMSKYLYKDTFLLKNLIRNAELYNDETMKEIHQSELDECLTQYNEFVEAEKVLRKGDK